VSEKTWSWVEVVIAEVLGVFPFGLFIVALDS
jgi:hypothetical protein